MDPNNFKQKTTINYYQLSSAPSASADAGPVDPSQELGVCTHYFSKSNHMDTVNECKGYITKSTCVGSFCYWTKYEYSSRTFLLMKKYKFLGEMLGDEHTGIATLD